MKQIIAITTLNKIPKRCGECPYVQSSYSERHYGEVDVTYRCPFLRNTVNRANRNEFCPLQELIIKVDNEEKDIKSQRHF